MFPQRKKVFTFTKKNSNKREEIFLKTYYFLLWNGARELYARTFYISCAFYKLIPTSRTYSYIFYSEMIRRSSPFNKKESSQRKRNKRYVWPKHKIGTSYFVGIFETRVNTSKTVSFFSSTTFKTFTDRHKSFPSQRHIF